MLAQLISQGLSCYATLPCCSLPSGACSRFRARCHGLPASRALTFPSIPIIRLRLHDDRNLPVGQRLQSGMLDFRIQKTAPSAWTSRCTGSSHKKTNSSSQTAAPSPSMRARETEAYNIVKVRIRRDAGSWAHAKPVCWRSLVGSGFLVADAGPWTRSVGPGCAVSGPRPLPRAVSHLWLHALLERLGSMLATCAHLRVPNCSAGRWGGGAI